MFAYPEGDDCHLWFAKATPNPQFHTFVITDSQGNRQFGACLRTFELLAETERQFFKDQLKHWVELHFRSSDIEYAIHIKERLAAEQALLTQPQDSTVLELIQLYNGLLEPYKLALMDVDSELYVPKCTVVVSKLPMHGQLRDWLVELCKLNLDKSEMEQ